MRLAEQVRPISFLKANTTKVIADLKKDREPLVITQNGRATLVVQDIETFEKTQQTLALLKLLVLRSRDYDPETARSLDEAFAELETSDAGEALPS